MKSYLLKTLVTLLFSVFIMFMYYGVYDFHTLWFSGTWLYIGLILIIYACYKLFYILLWYREIVFTPFKIICWFFVHLFLLCWLFFIANKISASSALILFTKVVFFLSIPFSIFTILYWFGNKILSYYQEFSSESSIFQFLLSIWFGIFGFLFLFTTIWIIGFYNRVVVAVLLVVFSAIWYRQILWAISWVWNHKIILKNHDFSSKKISERIHPFLLSTEFLFIIVTGLIAVNFISVFRPFPIGWDDLGVYMNYPKLLSQAGELLPLWQMYSWQLFTWIWFLFWSQTLAFFLNSFSWVLASVCIYLFLYWCISKNTDKKTYINIPLLGTSMFLAMPMVVFQIAKDMKLDIALLSVGLISLYALYHVSTQKKLSEKSQLFYIAIAWLLAGLCFSIKVTSLLFIVSFIAVLFFTHLGISAFFWYLAIFFALFTKLGLWDLMNVVYPKDDITFINIFSISSLLIWLWCIGYSFFPKKIDIFVSLCKKVFVFIIFISISLSPWLVKNISEVWIQNITARKLLSGQPDRIEVDYRTLYTQQELTSIENQDSAERITSSWTTDNEDFWRYFWYEEGINNYIKLPWNLTMQVNQKWDFTDITYIFLALLPALLLFLPYRFRYTLLAIIWVLILELCLFLNLPSQQLFTHIFSTLHLPLWYSVILWIFLLPLFFFRNTLDLKTPLVQIFLINLVFTIVYVFLWNISAFWVVWYGIMMYFSFIFMISICLYYVSSYTSWDDEDYIKLWVSSVIFALVSFYFIFSGIPHMMKNLNQAGYPNYKLWALNEDESIFQAHPDYLPILFDLNIKDEFQQEMLTGYQNQIKNILDAWDYNPQFTQILQQTNTITGLWSFFRGIESFRSQSVVDIEFKKQIKYIARDMYGEIIYPNNEIKNDTWIYRIGTFLKYFISENNKRLFEDSLITKFDTYMYDENPDTTVDRMKRLWFEHLLVDLNAATIDKDPRRDLTRRYENLLETFTSEKLELVETDSICLKVALDNYAIDKDIWAYLALAGASHNSYAAEETITRSQKNIECLSVVYNLLKENKITQTEYAYLFWLYSQIKGNNIDMENQQETMRFLQNFVNSGFKVLFKIQ